MERGSDKHSPRIDEQLDHDIRPMMQGAPVEGRVEEEREQEGPAEGEPTSDARISGEGVGAPQGLGYDEVERRTELARHLRPSVFPARLEALVESAQQEHAPEELIGQLRQLPDQLFPNVQAVWTALGGRRETREPAMPRPPAAGRRRPTVTQRQLRAGDLTFSMLEAGPRRGDAVLLLHGFPQRASTWVPLMQRVASAGYRVVAPDQRGYSSGARPTGARAYRMRHLVDDVLRIADELRIDRFHLVGHDWGAIVGWALAAGHPERVSTWTAMSTPHPRAYLSAMPRSLQSLRSAYIGFFTLPWLPETLLGGKDAALLSALLGASGLPRATAHEYAHALAERDALRAALNWYRAARAWDLLSVGRVRVSTLFLWGRHDVALGPSAAKATRSWVSGGYRFAPLDAGHWLPETQVEEIAPLLLAHLAGDARVNRAAS